MGKYFHYSLRCCADLACDGRRRIGEKRWTASFDWRKYYMQRSLLDQPDALRWEYPTIQGPKPSPRFVQTASLVGDSEIVFIGGKQNEESRLDEIHILVHQHLSSPPPPNSLPESRLTIS